MEIVLQAAMALFAQAQTPILIRPVLMDLVRLLVIVVHQIAVVVPHIKPVQDPYV